MILVGIKELKNMHNYVIKSFQEICQPNKITRKIKNMNTRKMCYRKWEQSRRNLKENLLDFHAWV